MSSISNEEIAQSVSLLEDLLNEGQKSRLFNVSMRQVPPNIILTLHSERDMSRSELVHVKSILSQAYSDIMKAEPVEKIPNRELMLILNNSNV